jgi:hypothetical protein
MKLPGSGPAGGVKGDALDPEVGLVFLLVAETANFDIDEPGELAGKVIHVDACAPIDVGRIFVGEEESFHSGNELGGTGGGQGAQRRD